MSALPNANRVETADEAATVPHLREGGIRLRVVHPSPIRHRRYTTTTIVTALAMIVCPFVLGFVVLTATLPAEEGGVYVAAETGLPVRLGPITHGHQRGRVDEGTTLRLDAVPSISNDRGRFYVFTKTPVADPTAWAALEPEFFVLLVDRRSGRVQKVVRTLSPHVVVSGARLCNIEWRIGGAIRELLAADPQAGRPINPLAIYVGLIIQDPGLGGTKQTYLARILR